MNAMAIARPQPRRFTSERAPWCASSTVAADCTLHQLAPYIGRMKTTIARYLVEAYTNKGDLILDPFCGSGVVPLEASLLGRRVIAADINPYGVTLTRAKLDAPRDERAAQRRLKLRWAKSLDRVAYQDLRSVPAWVRAFFHPETLRSALALRDELVAKSDWFLLACLLGILHHQRPGFLSYPSSHLVPYLRDRLFPRAERPELYQARDVHARMTSKVRRAYRRLPEVTRDARVLQCDSRTLRVTGPVDAIITSPPYMNELDYVRDNRLRLWFLLRALPDISDPKRRNREEEFRKLMKATLRRLARTVADRGAIVLVVGDASRGARTLDSAEAIRAVFAEDEHLRDFALVRTIEDTIPDVRRSRRDLAGTKRETVLVFARHPGLFNQPSASEPRQRNNGAK